MVPNLQNGNISIAGRVCLRSKRTLQSFDYFTFSNLAANSLPPRKTSIFFPPLTGTKQ